MSNSTHFASSHSPEPSHDDCQAVVELIPAYAVGATDAAETRFVDERLGQCPEARAELAEFQQLMAAMRDSVQEVEPPARLLDALKQATSISSAPPAVVTQQRVRWPAYGLVAALVILIASNVYWLARVNALENTHTELLQRMATQQETLILSRAEDIAWARLPSAQDNAASAIMMWNENSQTGMLYAQNFPPLDEDKVYQLWLSADNQRVSGGVFRVNENGNGSLVFQLDQPIRGFVRAGITTEPEGGSEGPTSDAVVRGEL